MVKAINKPIFSLDSNISKKLNLLAFDDCPLLWVIFMLVSSLILDSTLYYTGILNKNMDFLSFKYISL